MRRQIAISYLKAAVADLDQVFADLELSLCDLGVVIHDQKKEVRDFQFALVDGDLRSATAKQALFAQTPLFAGDP